MHLYDASDGYYRVVGDYSASGSKVPVSTSLVIVTPSDGLLQLLVLVLHTTVEAQQIVVWLEFDVQVVVL